MHFFNPKTYLMALAITTTYGESRADPITEEACIQACESNPDPLNLDFNLHLLQDSATDELAEVYHHFVEVHRDIVIKVCMAGCKQAETKETFEDIFKAPRDHIQAMQHCLQPFKVPALLRWAAYVFPYLTTVIEAMESMHENLDEFWLELEKDLAQEEGEESSA